MTATVSLHYIFHAPAERLFEVLFGDVRDVQRYTHAPARVDARAGGVYSLFDGQISGLFSEASVARTVLSWRMKNWPEGVASTVTLTIMPRADAPDTCSVRVLQEGVPLRDACDNADQDRAVEEGWRTRIFGGISKFVGIASDKGDEDDD